MRRAYWQSLVRDVEGAPNFRSVHGGLLGASERLRDAERVTIWAATGLNEQLFIAHVLHRAEQWAVDASKLYIVQFERRSDGIARVMGTGELNEECMGAHPEPVPLSPAAVSDYRAAWSAITSPDPKPIEQFAATQSGANEWLKQAMHLLLRRFPDKRSGLPFWDFALLNQVRARGPRAVRVIGYTMGDAYDDADLIGDWILFERLLRMSDPGLPAPLLATTGDRTNMRDVQVALTPFGLDVLESRASYYPTNPIDDWIAGVKLSSAEGLLWFNDGGTLVSNR
jgi:hypothetical protein